MKKIYFLLCIFILFLIIIYPTNVQASMSLDDIMDGADDFIDIGEQAGGVSETIDNYALQNTSDFLYNVLLGISSVLAIVIGMILGIKYMSATSEDKADIKQTLPAYIISCIVVFGAFTIWKVLINIIQ